LILARTGEGRTRAMARGVRFGPKPKLSAFQIAEAIRRREAGEAMTDIDRSYGVSHSTISRLQPKPTRIHLVAAGTTDGVSNDDGIHQKLDKPSPPCFL
jgi:DNA invertase Pin-like site-specific DNA recombinase